MKRTRLAVVVAGLISLTGAPAGTASATAIVDCQILWWTLELDTHAAGSSFTNHQDFTDSLAILQSVWPRLEDVKHPFVEEDMTRFQMKLNGLAAASPPNLDPSVAQRLSAEAQDVIVCANTLDLPPP
jgi:hypothetical protein